MYEITPPQLEVIKEAAAHLAKQRKKAVDIHGGCMYHTPDDLQCGVGALIPPELYTSRLEGHCGSELIEKSFPAGIHLAGRLGAFAPDILDRIQEYHDHDRYAEHIARFKDQSDEFFAAYITNWLVNDITVSFTATLNEARNDLEITE